MFTQFFSLTFNPFTKEIDSSLLFQSKEYMEISARLEYLKQTRGIGLLIGEPGAGKSTCLRRYRDHLNPSLFKPCYFALSTVTVKEFYRALAYMLGEEPKYQKIALFHQIQSAILTLYKENRITPVIILDEIHLASNKLLEDIRLLFNFSMDSENPFILILAGQPLIRNKLSLNINQPLKQRIGIKYMLQGLKKDEINAYCISRLEIAGCSEELIETSAYEAIYGITKGFPRLINNLMTGALLYAYSKKLRKIDEEVIYQAQNELSF
ncbi:ExeA family protein [Marinisporobacter balticus]|uniref:Type II secretory pathway predicted ATPase ExeA n=1 Tax=Marinisporobacter balticus TaxID=2018667 RepID=A0A4R2KCI4_9FIRM|nr:AAA family ATPase [Marinisporobacter balticus]TCO67588.1 type II secretory pathway predicted ATPase ExeA [Marinisporobacter balticus]